MNKLKKLFVLVLVAAVVSLGLTGCKQKNEQPAEGTSSIMFTLLTAACGSEMKGLCYELAKGNTSSGCSLRYTYRLRYVTG